jgi:elongation factor G
MERYLGGEEIDQSVLIDDLEEAVARASFFPVIPALVFNVAADFGEGFV